ncbi:MAG TPA: response regulator [Gemmatimonadaceae bacterium]|nr:response regulator [Gemmatimonadaceae bacterium]
MSATPVSRAELLASPVLIVDDEVANVRLLERILERAGFTSVRTTTNPTEAVQIFCAARPDLVCLDVHMPIMDGFAVLERMRAECGPAEFLPVLAITGDASPETRQRVLVAGAKDFLEKPFESAEVLVRVENLLTTRLLHRSLAQQNEILEQKVRERTAELESALIAAEAASRAKGQFLATMSHELRTPLNAVIGFSRQLMKNKAGNLMPMDLEFAQRISESGAHLLGIINDILDLSRIEAGKVLVEPALVSLPPMIQSVLDEAMSDPGVHARGVAGVISLPSPLDEIVSDPTKLRRILTNLVSNAAKFTQRGQVRIGVVANPKGDALRIDVIDTGIGIPAERLGAIFEMFEQADNSTQRRFGGTGLGLAISRTLCEMLGYRLHVVSEQGVGSAFSILLDSGAPAPRSYAEVAAEYA